METLLVPDRHRRRSAPLPALLLAALFAAAGCAQKETPQSSSTSAAPAPQRTTAATGPLKIALITPSPISDKGWGASADAGMQKIKTEMNAQTTPPIESPGLAEVAGAMRNLAQNGNTLVFAHGSEYDEAARQVAGQFPQTTFVVMGGRAIGPNLVPIQFASGQATYLAGMLAGGMTKTGKLGLVGPNKIPIIASSFAAFEKGAKAVKPDVSVATTYVGDDKDAARAKQQTQALLDAGADVILHNANAAGAGVFQAVMDKNGAMVIGANADQSDQATPKNLGSFILDVPSAMHGVAQSVQSGASGGKPFAAGVKDKAVGFVFNPKFEGTIPADLKAKMAAAEAAMAAGTLDPTK